jgi:hypothetical protein
VVEGYFPDRPHHSISVQVEEDRSSLILSPHGIEGSPEERASIPTLKLRPCWLWHQVRWPMSEQACPLASRQIQLQQFTEPGPSSLLSLDLLQQESEAFQPLSWFGRRSVAGALTCAGGLLWMVCRRHLRWTSRKELSTACLICWRTGSQLGHCGIRRQCQKSQVLVCLWLNSVGACTCE